jgi:hypothetical protein
VEVAIELCAGLHHRELTVVPNADVRPASGDVARVHGDGRRGGAGRSAVAVVTWRPVADAGPGRGHRYIGLALGAGAPLLPRRLELRLEETGRNGDFVAARYSVVREGS